jgi:hypothetical protein
MITIIAWYGFVTDAGILVHRATIVHHLSFHLFHRNGLADIRTGWQLASKKVWLSPWKIVQEMKWATCMFDRRGLRPAPASPTAVPSPNLHDSEC